MANFDNVTAFLNRLNDSSSPMTFTDSMAFIDTLYALTPTAFQCGNANNAAGENTGSCKIFSFGLLHQLNEPQTLRSFGVVDDLLVKFTEAAQGLWFVEF